MQWKQSWGDRPTIVRGCPATMSRWPITFPRSEANLRFHNPSEIRAVGLAPRQASLEVKLRPRIGFTPRIGKKFADTRCAAGPFSGCPTPVMLPSVPRLWPYIQRNNCGGHQKVSWGCEPLAKF